MITDYTSLQEAVGAWLNRTDENLVDRVPEFIQLTEAEIFRIYAARGNEINLELDRTSEDPVTNTIAVPSDYREMLTFTVDERPLTRRSLTAIQRNYGINTVVGWPRDFARELGNFLLWPFPDAGRVYQLNYYAKLDPLATTATNSVLTSEPGLYLYGALVEAEPWLRGDQSAGLLAIWKARYSAILAGVALERDEEDRSGSNVSVQNAFGGGSGTNSVNNRRGRA